MHAATEAPTAPHAHRPTPLPTGGILRVGSHRLDVGALRLLGDTDQPRLTLKAVQVLLELHRHRGATVSREHLLDTVWRDTSPTPEVVTQSIKELRRVLGDSTDVPQYIETVPRVGYRLICEAEWDQSDNAANDEATSETAAERTTPVPSARRSPQGLLVVLSIVLLGTLSALLMMRSPLAWTPWSDSQGWVADHMQRVTTSPLLEVMPRISDNGSQVLYLAADLHPESDNPYMRAKLRGLGGSRTIDVEAPPQTWERSASWSPSGNEITIVRADSETCRILGMPVLGGAPRLLGRCLNDRPPQFDWSPDGQHLIGSDFDSPEITHSMLTSQPVGGGEIRPLEYPHQEGEVDLAPRFSPDKEWIAFRRGLLPYSDLYLMQAEPPRTLRRLTRLGSRLAGFDWTRDGKGIVFSSDHAGVPALYTVDIEHMQVEPLGIEPARFPSMARQADIGVFSIPDDVYQMALMNSDGRTPAQFVAPSTTSDREADLSPEGRRLAFVTRRSERDQLWLHDLHSGEAFALTELSEGVPRFPDWRSDGQAIAFVLRGLGAGAAYEVDIETRRQRRLSPLNLDVHYVTYGDDGRVFAVALKEGEQALFELLADGSAQMLERNVSFARAGDAETGVIFNYLNRPGLFRLGEDGRAPVKIADGPNFRYEMPWTLSGSRAFHVLPEFPTHRLGEVNLHTGEERIVGRVDLGLAIVAVSSDRAGKQLLVWVSTAEGSDIGSFRLLPRQPAKSEPASTAFQ